MFSSPQPLNKNRKVTWSSLTVPNSPSTIPRSSSFTERRSMLPSMYEEVMDPQHNIEVVTLRELNPLPIGPVVSNWTREKLIRKVQKKTKYQIGEVKAQVGFISYVGSPVNGNIVVGNPELVDFWLNYIKKAAKKEIVKSNSDALTVHELNKLCNVAVLPGNRHEFNISFDIHSELSCAAHSHDKRVWESPVYPCKITSCQCYSAN